MLDYLPLSLLDRQFGRERNVFAMKRSLSQLQSLKGRKIRQLQVAHRVNIQIRSQGLIISTAKMPDLPSLSKSNELDLAGM